MGILKIPILVKLICAITFSKKINIEDIYDTLHHAYGDIDSFSRVYNFKYTKYYEKEMTGELKKVYISFKPLVTAETLPEIKTRTNLFEKMFAVNSKRVVNLDPGYIEKAKLILVTTKDFSHRIYLGSGIFGDLQYRLKDGHYQISEWTYPDYREKEVLEFFLNVRNKYCKDLVNEK